MCVCVCYQGMYKTAKWIKDKLERKKMLENVFAIARNMYNAVGQAPTN